MVRAVALNFPGCEKDKNSSELISAKLVRSTLQGDRFGSKAALIEMCEDDDSQLSEGVVSHRKVSDPVGILSTRKESSKRCKVVSFSDEPVVMGYGGDQVDVDVELGKSSDSAEDEDDISEEERHTQFQTKCNTDFNSVTSNLLGKTQVLSDVVEESDKVTERSALTGRHKKFTPVVCIAPFGGGRGSARVKVNLVQPMKNGEIISDKSISNEMVEKKSSKSKCKSSDFQKVTRLDELSDVLVKDRVGSPKGESVAVKEVRKSERVSNETKVQTKLSFKIGGTHDKNHNIADSSKDQHDKISNLKTEGGSIENTSIQSVVAKDEEELISSISITSKPNSSVSVSPSFQRIEHCNEFGCSELTKDRSPSQDKKLVVESSTTQSKVSGSDANHGDLQKIDDSKNCSPALELTESRLKSISKVENHIQTSQASASATSLHENSVGSKAAFADTRACVSALKDGSVNSSRTSFLHTMTENRDSRSSQNQDQSSLGKTEVTETKEDKVVSKNSPASTPSLSDQCQRNGSPREKPKIAAKPPGLNRLSRSFSNEEENGSSTDIRKVDLSVVPSPTVKKLSPTEHLPDYSAELADKVLDASSRLTKLVEDSAKPYLNKVDSYDQFDEQKLSRTEQIMKREKDLEKLREDLLRNHISHKPEKTSDKNSTNNAHICEVSPVPPTRCSRKVNDKSEFGGKHGQASTGMNVDKEENSENMRRGSANSNNSVRIRPSSSDGSEESSKTHELRDSALVDSESTGGATSLEQEIAKLISDSFSKPLEGVHDYSLGSPVVSPEGPSVDLFERKASLEPDDDDGADDLPPSMSMRASSVSPAQRRRGPGVRFDSGTKRASRSGGVVVEARSQSMPRADAGTRQSAGCSVGGKQLGSGKGAERRSRRDDSRRQGKFSLMKLLKFGPKEEKRKDRGRGIDGIRYKPQIIHPLDLAPAGQVEVVVRTEEEKRRDEEERERKKALLIAEGIRVYDSPNASKISRIPTPSSPSLPPHQLGYNSEGRPCPPPPPRRTSSIDPSNSAAVTSCRPPPPSVLAVSRHMGPATPGTPGTRDTQYANLGVARSDLVPSKPGRTGSLRHRSEKSSPSQDSRALQGVHELLPSADVSGPASLPLTFHHCPEDGGVTSSDAASTAATGCRKPAEQLSPSSSAPADTLEQSYEAVISSNHQALRQMLEQMCESVLGVVPDALRHIQHASLAFSHFQLRPKLVEPAASADGDALSAPCALGHCVLLAADFRRQPVTLLLQSVGAAGREGRATAVCSVTPLAQFRDLVPTRLLPADSAGNVQSATTAASVLVLPSMRAIPLWRLVCEWPPVCERAHERSVCLLLLQTVHRLAELSARGQTLVDKALCQLIAVRFSGKPSSPEVDGSWHLAVIYGNSTSGSNCLSLCQVALVVLLRMLGVSDSMERVVDGRGVSVPSHVPSLNLFELLVILLQREVADTLLHVRAVLEAVLWGPGEGEGESSLQRWLDRRRAEVLARLVARGRLWDGNVDVEDRLQVQFLAETDVARLQNAAALLSI